MARSRVPVKGSIGKSILTGGSSTTVVQQTIVQQTVKGTAGVSGVASTIWPLISQIPQPVLDIAALSTSDVGLLAFNGTHIIERAVAVVTPLAIANATGAAGNPTIGFVAGITTNQVLAGPSPPSFRALTTSDIPTLPVAKISGLATVAITGSYNDLTSKPLIPADISMQPYLLTTSSIGALPNSSALIAGTNVTFDTSTPNQLKINATGGGGSSPLTTKGDIFGFDTADARIPVGADGYVLAANSLATLGVNWIPAVGTGTVTAVGIADLSSVPIYAVSTAPVTSIGTLDITLLTQSAAKVFTGPVSGSAAQPTFRSLASTDIPTLPAAKISGLATVATTGLLSDLADVAISGVSTGQVLTWNGTKWDNEAGGGGGGITLAAAILADSPFAFWKCDDASTALIDSSGNGFDLNTVSGTVGYRQSGLIQTVPGTTFALSGNLANSGGNDGWELTSQLGQTYPLLDWSCEFVFCPLSFTTGNYRIFDLRPAGSGAAVITIFYGGGSGLECFYPSNFNELTVPIPIGNPCHVVTTCSTTGGTSTVTVYINGVFAGSYTAAASATSGTMVAQLGALVNFPAASNSFFIGYLALFSTALTAAQVSVHASAAGKLGV